MRSVARTTFLVGFLTLLAAVAWWVIGFLPWVVGGFRWPRYDEQAMSGSAAGVVGVRMPVPLIADLLPLLVAGAVVGGVLAGLTPILFTQLNRWFAAFWTLVVVTAATVMTAYLSAGTIRDAARTEFAGDRRVLLGLCLLLATASAIGTVTGLISVIRHGFVAIAGGLLAAVTMAWIQGFLVGRHPSAADLDHITTITRLAVAAVLGVSLAISVHRTMLSALWWPFAIALAWCAVPLNASIIYLAAQLRPSTGLPGGLWTIIGDSRHVFSEAFGNQDQPWWPLAVAVLIGLVGLVGFALLRRKRRAELAAEEEDDPWVNPWRREDDEPDDELDEPDDVDEPEQPDTDRLA